MIHCHSAVDLRHELMTKRVEPDEVYAILEPASNGEQDSAEIRDSDSGDTLCHVEADSMARVQRILADCSVEHHE